MNNEDFVTYEIAQTLKKAGFNYPCYFYYTKGDALVRKRDDSPIEACVQLIEWLFGEKYKLNEVEL